MSDPTTPNEETRHDKDTDIHSYFEVPGGWGDDSKYLVGLSTGLVVFEPYGFWTNIEIANGVAQDKPVAIIIDPANLEPGGKYYEQMKNGERFVEVKIPLPGNTEGSYRVYRDAGEASKWIHDRSVEKFMKMNAAPQAVPQIDQADLDKQETLKREVEAIRAAQIAAQIAAEKPTEKAAEKK